MTPAEKKRFALEYLLADGPKVYLLINPDAPNVVLPPSTVRPVVLVLGLNLPIPISDLQITNDGWSATLAFNRRPFKVEVPWSAVCEIVDSTHTKGVRFPEDYPKDIQQQVEQHAAKNAAERKAAEGRKTLPPGWRVIEGEKKKQEGAA